MEKDLLKEIDLLFDNNKKIIEELVAEKRLLENVLLDNRLPGKFKEQILTTYKELGKVVEKRYELNEVFRTSEIVGFLYNKRQEKYIDALIKTLKKISINKKTDILCFTIDEIDMEDELIRGRLISSGEEEEIKTRIPSLIYNIGYYTKSTNINKIKQLFMIHNVTVVNSKNIFNQGIIFDIISSLSISKQFLPTFESFYPSSILNHIEKFGTVFLFPENGLLKNKIIKITKENDGVKNNYSVNIGSNFFKCSEKELFKNIKEIIRNKKYMIIEGKNVLKWNDSPIEARVYVQKSITGKWDITEMIAKNDVFSNDPIYMGTTDYLKNVLLNSAPKYIKTIQDKLVNYSIDTCVYLDYYISNLGSCTLDFIIDKEGNPYLFHFSGWDKKNYLFKLRELRTWDKYINNAMDYLIYLKNEDK